MEAVITAKKKRPVYTLPYTRKLTPEEIDTLLEHWNYVPDRFGDEEQYEYSPVPLYDEYGNPTVETMDAYYEDKYDIGGEDMTLDEFHGWLNDLHVEVEHEKY